MSSGIRSRNTVGLAGDDQKAGGILADKIVDDGAFFFGVVVGKGYADRISFLLQYAGDAFKDFRVILVVDVGQHYSDQMGAGSLQIAGRGIGNVFQFFNRFQNFQAGGLFNRFIAAQTTGYGGDGNTGVFGYVF